MALEIAEEADDRADDTDEELEPSSAVEVDGNPTDVLSDTGAETVDDMVPVLVKETDG